jgi:hypothetical protein
MIGKTSAIIVTIGSELFDLEIEGEQFQKKWSEMKET